MMKNGRDIPASRLAVYLEDECPRLGAGLRLVWPRRIGWKWVHVSDALGRKARIKREVWEKIINSSAF